MSTLFLWEEAKNDTRRISLLEQLKNLLPMGKKASADLAAHQQRHGIKYELEMPNPNNAILAASRVIQRQVSHIIKLQSRFEADVNEGWGQNPSDSSEQTSLSRPWSSPPGSGGIALDSPRHVPQQNANRVSSTQYGASHMSDDGAGASQRGVIIEPLNPRGSRSPEVEISSPPADGADNQAKWVPSRTSSEDSVSSLPTGENYTGWKGFLMSYYGIQTVYGFVTGRFHSVLMIHRSQPNSTHRAMSHSQINHNWDIGYLSHLIPGSRTFASAKAAVSSAAQNATRSTAFAIFVSRRVQCL
ncbi:hypothetical protein F4679DRAFT_130828 [Xylaria curta]|nr:hypothetical protein F4679DRAFT_130828 [Xylaria curta]